MNFPAGTYYEAKENGGERMLELNLDWMTRQARSLGVILNLALADARFDADRGAAGVEIGDAEKQLFETGRLQTGVVSRLVLCESVQ